MEERQKSALTDNPPSTDSIDAHRLLVMLQFISALVVGVALLIMIKTMRMDMILDAVLAAGALGGFVSSLRRLYSFQDVFPRGDYGRLFRRVNVYVIAYSLVPPLVGMIGAVALYLLFAGGVLTGIAFPAFECAQNGNGCINFQDFVSFWRPVDAESNAKAVIWGFIAGFSEQFVPDLLSRLGNDGK